MTHTKAHAMAAFQRAMSLSKDEEAAILATAQSLDVPVAELRKLIQSSNEHGTQLA